MIRKVIISELICSTPNCRPPVKVALMENSMGIIVTHEYLCSTCLGLMAMGRVTDDDIQLVDMDTFKCPDGVHLL